MLFDCDSLTLPPDCARTSKEMSGLCSRLALAAVRPAPSPTIELHSARPFQLSLAEAYPILRLRVDVFVVEQECAYPELDGRDLEPSALWIWATDSDGKVAGTLRVLTDPDGRARIGRVATAEDARANGTASAMMNHALGLLTSELSRGLDARGQGEREVTLDAQSRLEGWYERFGFLRCGAEYVEDGIPHIPMTRKLSVSP